VLRPDECAAYVATHDSGAEGRAAASLINEAGAPSSLLGQALSPCTGQAVPVPDRWITR